MTVDGEDESLRDATGRVRIGIEQQQAEFIAAQSGQEMICRGFGLRVRYTAMRDALFHDLGDFLQQGITGCMAAGVIDQFELIEVDIAEGVCASGGLDLVQGALQSTFHRTTVEQAGQWIVEGEPA